jgi:hypothetical protein
MDFVRTLTKKIVNSNRAMGVFKAKEDEPGKNLGL